MEKLLNGEDGMTGSELERLHGAKVEGMDCSELVNIEEVEIQQDGSAEQRMQDFFEKIRNPYCFLCGNTPVKVDFIDTEIALNARLRQYCISGRK